MKEFKIKNIKSFFLNNNYIESVLISFQYDNFINEFVIETDYINNTLQKGEREFRKTIFKSISKFYRKKGTIKKYNSVLSDFRSSDYQGTVVIQGLYIDNFDEYSKIIIDFGVNFGQIEFLCKSIEFIRKTGIGKMIDGKWEYTDIETNEQFDFYNPFDLTM